MTLANPTKAAARPKNPTHPQAQTCTQLGPSSSHLQPPTTSAAQGKPDPWLHQAQAASLFSAEGHSFSRFHSPTTHPRMFSGTRSFFLHLPCLQAICIRLVVLLKAIRKSYLFAFVIRSSKTIYLCELSFNWFPYQEFLLNFL